jgi:hypothetical protein
MMGPKLIIDKSAMESLNASELEMLDRYFQIIIPSIFPLEVLGDLAAKVRKGSKGTAESRVTALARGISINSYITKNYREVCIGSLLGFEVKEKAGWIIDQSHEVHTEFGTGIVIDQTPMDTAVLRWKMMQFNISDRESAAMWREAHKTLPLERYKAAFDRAEISIEKLNTFSAISEKVEQILKTPVIQNDLFKLILDQVNPPPADREIIVRQWRMKLTKSLPRFAKYAAFCMRANLLLAIAAMNNLVRHKETSRVDIEYCYYLPQCEVFVSSDTLHENLATHLLGTDRDFVRGEKFKADLRRRAEEWETLTHEQKCAPERRFGAPPISMEGSIVSELWEKYC